MFKNIKQSNQTKINERLRAIPFMLDCFWVLKNPLQACFVWFFCL